MGQDTWHNDQTEPTEPEPATFAEVVEQISIEFDNACEDRHAMGAEKYGPGKFLTVDTLQEAIDEIVDLANYARYTYIRVRLLQASLSQVQPVEQPFVKAGDATRVREG